MSVDAILIAGPTASGKSEAALALAERIGGALINTDSMQVYREALILTARPDSAAMARVPHFLYGHVSVREAYSAARYQTDAVAALEEARALGRVPILVGGTGLYFGALTDGLSDMPAIPDAIRKEIRARRAAIGAEAFHAELAAQDSETAARLRPSDTQRVLRAAEVLKASGRPLSQWQRGQGRAPLSGRKLARFVLSPARPELHRRIAVRFEQMLELGALDEAARLKGLDPELPSSKMLGLRELWDVLDGSANLEDAKAAAIVATRQYAKRQLTWFRHRMTDWRWISEAETREVIAQMLEVLN